MIVTCIYLVNDCIVNCSNNLQYNCCCLESRAFSDISLSPQRGSFNSGSKYKSNRESVNKDGSGDPPATPLSSRVPEEGSKFNFHDDNATQKEFSQYRTPHGPQSSSQFSWQRSQSSSTYRDYNGRSTSQDDDNRTFDRTSYLRYNHSYQQESYRGNGNSRGYYQSESYSEPGCSLDQAVELSLWSLVEKMKLKK